VDETIKNLIGNIVENA